MAHPAVLRRLGSVLPILLFLAGVLDANPVTAQTLTAQITNPVDGATNPDMSKPVQWTTIPSAQAYYLYIGSTVGGKDLVDTGEIHQTSFAVQHLPVGRIVYVRLHTLAGGVWRHSDTSFTPPPVATMTYPPDGATSVDRTQPIQWTAVDNAQAYYLYVGSTRGAKNLVDTGEIHRTSYLPASLPVGQILFARLHTLAGGVWRYVDVTFSVASSAAIATITYPPNGAVGVDMSHPIEWTLVVQAQAYYLYVGSTPGSNDLVNSGEIQQTSYAQAYLPAGRTVYVRMYALVAGAWRYSDSSFTTAVQSLVATLTYPPDGGKSVDLTQPIRWTSVTNAQTYYLYIGSTKGEKDVVDSGELSGQSYQVGINVVAGQTLYARIYAEVADTWRYTDSTFTAASSNAEFLYPLDGAVGVVATEPFRWTRPEHADVQELHVGTSPGADDVFNSGQKNATSALVDGLPTVRTLYARLLSRISGSWRHTDIAFSLDSAVPALAMLAPRTQQTTFDTAQPFEWSEAPLARGYRLTIGTAAGRNDVHDSGEIHVTRRFVPGLPLGPLFGRVQALLDGQWRSTDFAFSVTKNTASSAVQIASALWATDQVRKMALADNRAFSWTILAETAPGMTVNCSYYAEALLKVLIEINVQLPARRLAVALNSNAYDAHTLVEMFDSASRSWMILDPTFDLTVKRTGDGNWATAEDLSRATRAGRWGDVSYQLLGDRGDYYARGYYLDYPLLFVNVYHAGQAAIHAQGGAVLPFMVAVPMPVVSVPGVYAVGCSASQSTTLMIDGVAGSVDCSGVDGLSYVFSAASIRATDATGAAVTVYQPSRFVF